MQLAAVTDIITHFVGLFRVLEEPVRIWVKPDGSGQDHPVPLDDGNTANAGKASAPIDTSPAAPFAVHDPDPAAEGHLHAWRGAQQHLPAVPAPHLQLQPAAPIEYPPLGAGASFPPGMVAVVESGGAVVWHGADQTVVDDHQVNTLIANVSYVDNSDAGAPPIPSDAPIGALVAQSHATFSGNVPALGQSDLNETKNVKVFEDGLASGSSTAEHSLTHGSYTDGVFSASDGSPGQLRLPLTALDTATPTAKDVSLAQTIVMGHNIAGNVAFIVDTSAAPLTQIVEGNAFHANLIIQSNVVQNIDQVSATAGAFDRGSISTDGNAIHNTAHFEQLPNVVSTPVTGSFGQSWNVQIINGDFYDINAITQQNVLINDTLYAGAATNDHYYAVLGGNTQLNNFAFSHDAPTYDLLIVEGNSYSADAIYQNNVLLNDTKTRVDVSASNEGINTITAGHNTVTNDASIAEYGTQNWQPTSSDIQALVHSLAAKGSFAGGNLGLATLGGTINVEIVTGDYYKLNLISQTNVIANSSMTLADLTKAGFQVPTNVTVGNNVLANSAAIVSAGALNQQYVAGKPYETSMLIQSNIVSTHSEVSGGTSSGPVPELVAYLNTGDAHDAAGSPGVIHSAPTTTSAAQQDILAGHLH